MSFMLDTNICIYAIKKRPPQVLRRLRENLERGLFISAVTDIFYHLNKALRNSFEAQDQISELIDVLSILNVTEQDIRAALRLRWKDFEDAVQYAVALANHVDAIITRNVRDFERTDIPVLTPGEFLSE